VARLEEITYEAGRHALADQEALVAGIMQRTGMLLAAHALVASFLGAAVIRAHGLDGFGWIALCALVLGLGYSYQAMREMNERKVRLMSWLSGALGILMIFQTLAWLFALAVQ
jgi:hypothetical protein